MDALSDLAFFSLLVKHGNLSAAARELGLTPPAVSTRLAKLEQRLGVRLLNRSTRRVSVTQEGELYLAEGSRILADLQALERSVSSSRAQPQGLLRLNATFGFGRAHVAPAISDFARQYPEVEVQLRLTDRPLNLIEEGFDAAVRFGDLPDARLTARKIASNRRLLCASPRYLETFGEPRTPGELQRHRCIVVRENDVAYGTWRLESGSRTETVKVRGPVSSNDGQSALEWALDGHGIVMRSEWETAALLRAGRLRQVLTDWATPPADIHVLYPERLNLPAKTLAFVDFLAQRFARHLRAPGSQAAIW
ncbi:LysR family transcriptional regulator [Achromobacter xylosoxidans]|uniref:LysR family transcriptional regulator n=1 Tax=Alcaligenes xylosoxydans xylosoxydans TaxID=85698 RepID=UPI0006AC6C36|nr:LysR family transcriptional regulator [Achromobacter xylosoxidans]KOQ23047.1 LysR family transcriptional regulator [Achromobacter xylosoxidans]KOQ31093.1 LysR family transcriptional regulator [Achromobacter xylosoxidans]KOQ34837.1 LysR family transcriptional regulator [Achromobacter xylosoxidans]KOQ47184.1 LysR family transcriptional regulator [Achromobacter xylosoxidans]KOQ47648.1 LysR family transcriptional regulator [Achromobacter xylosoxidans]